MDYYIYRSAPLDSAVINMNLVHFNTNFYLWKSVILSSSRRLLIPNLPFLLDFRSKLFILMCSQAHNLPLGLRPILSQITDMAVGDTQVSISVMSCIPYLPSSYANKPFIIYFYFLLLFCQRSEKNKCSCFV
jgi:hypothetical protein